MSEETLVTAEPPTDSALEAPEGSEPTTESPALDAAEESPRSSGGGRREEETEEATATETVEETVGSTEPETVTATEPETVTPTEPESVTPTEPEAVTAESESPAAQTDAEPEADAEPQADDEPIVEAEAGAAPDGEKAAEPEAKTAAPAAPPRVEPEPVQRLRAAMEADQPVKGKVIGWNNGGFHVVVDGMTAFCPRSEIEVEAPKAPKTYLDQELVFRVLKIQRSGKRVVLSRSSHLRGERRLAREKLKEELEPGSVRKGRVASITDFGAFVDLNGLQGLVHISELSRQRVQHPSEVVEVGQEVEVKILRVESSGKRISLSMKALLPDPWDGVEEQFEEGAVVTGTVERTANFGAFIRLAPGLTGLLPTSVMSLPRDASPARIFPAGKEVSVQVQNVDRRRRRISLSLEGSQVEGSRKDFDSYREQSQGGSGFNALAAALDKARQGASD